MSASAAHADPCPHCGADLPRNASFCPACGTPADAGATSRIDVPLHETGPVPVAFDRAEPHFFGVPPPYLLLGVAVVVLVLALVLLFGGHWPYGLIVLGIAALLIAAFLELARRRPQSPVTRASTDARARAVSWWDTWRERAAATAEVRRIHTGLAVVEEERRTALLDLGRAAHAGDSSAEAGVRARLTELDDRERDLRRHLDQRLEQAGQRIHRARLSVQETVMVTPNEPSQPYPPPGEATPPEPAIVPEPYPPPNEGNPPSPGTDPGKQEDPRN